MILGNSLDCFLSELKTNPKSAKQAENWIMTAFWLKDSNSGHGLQELIEIALFLLQWASDIEK